METVVKREKQRRPYIYELDLLRSLTALSVVAVHTLSFTSGFYAADMALAVQLQTGLMVALHYNRAMFMFVTAFSLIYVYGRRANFSTLQFWKKRAIGVFLPYCLWSAIYILVDNHPKTLHQFGSLLFFDIISGKASFQLYYILLTLQFYILFPLFLWFIRRAIRHPWITLSVSFVLQIVGFYLDYHLIQARTFTGFGQFVYDYQSRIAFVYQFYFVLGGIAAWYLPQVKEFLLGHIRLIAGVFLVSLAGLWMHYFVQVRVFLENINYASSVLQPIMVVFSPIMIFFLFSIAALWVRSAHAQGAPRGYRFWHFLSNTSFGIYLIHALFLTYIFRWIVPLLPAVHPVELRIFIVWFLAAGGSVLVSGILLQIPVLSHFVGRSASWKKRSTGSQNTNVKDQSRSIVQAKPALPEHEQAELVR